MLERLRKLLVGNKQHQSDFATHSKGEIAHADPLNLFPGGFTQFNPSDLVSRKGLRVFDQMRLDDQVKAALSLKKYAILSPDWEITPKGSPESRFVEEALQSMDERFEESLWEVLSALDFGFSISEKVWDRGDNGSMIIKAIKGRKPHTFEFDVDVFGNINAIVQENRISDGGDIPRFDPSKFVIFSHQKEFGNPYGKALDPKTPIPTPDGWKCMDDLVEGSRVFDEEGKIRYVIGRKDWHDRPCYEVVFNTGSIIADSNHQWYTELPHQRDRGILGGIRTTEDIANSQSLPFWKSGHSIPFCKESGNQNNHYIKSVNPVENRRTVCIQVDSPSRLFLAGRNMVPTHNSDLEAAYTPWWHKTNTLKWMAMFLERFGIPPIFAFYNPNFFSQDQVGELKDVLKNMQASTTGIIPRPESDAFEPWTPNSEFSSSQTQRTFIPALDRQDQMIARALLMPGLIGLSPEGRNGSFARSQTHFGTFMIIIEALQQELARTVTKQVVEPLVRMNFGNVNKMPKFNWLPLTDDMRIELASQWANQVNNGTVTPDDADQNHIRRILNFPEREGGSNRGGNGEEEETEEESEPSGEALKFQEERNLEEMIGDLEGTTINTIQDKARQEQERIVNKIRSQGLNAQVVENLQSKLSVKRDLKKALSTAFERGKETESKQPEESQFLETLAVSLAALLAFKLLDESKETLIGALDRGESRETAIASLRENLQKFTDPDNPSQVKNLVKTETNRAFQKGKVQSVKPGESEVKGFRYVALDGGSHRACRFMDGRVIPVGSKFLSSLRPPLHHNCRSTLVPVEDFDESEKITPAQAGRAIQLAEPDFA